MSEAINNAIAWAKSHPVLAGGLVIGAGALGYLASRRAKTGEATGDVIDNGLGGGAGGGMDDSILQPYPGFPPPESGIIVESPYIGGGGAVTTFTSPAGPVSKSATFTGKTSKPPATFTGKTSKPPAGPGGVTAPATFGGNKSKPDAKTSSGFVKSGSGKGAAVKSSTKTPPKVGIFKNPTPTPGSSRPVVGRV